MWWAIPAVIATAIICMAIPMILDYRAEKKEDKENEHRNNTDTK